MASCSALHSPRVSVLVAVLLGVLAVEAASIAKN